MYVSIYMGETQENVVTLLNGKSLKYNLQLQTKEGGGREAVTGPEVSRASTVNRVRLVPGLSPAFSTGNSA